MPDRARPHRIPTPWLAAAAALLLLHAAAFPARAQVVDLDRLVRAFEPEIRRALEETGIPSITVALVAGDSVVWSGGFGYANLWARTPAVPESVYLLGSTVKPMIAAALLQQVEQGRLDLDAPVHAYLDDGLRIRGETPDRPVTLRHVLAHASGLPPDFGPVPVWSNQAPPPLRAYLETSLRVTAPPGEQVVYSNMGYTLAAYLLEQRANTPFRRYMQQHLFDPLHMNSTAYEPSPDMDERLAVPYTDTRSGTPRPAVRMKAHVWPAMVAYGTVTDLARWLVVNLNAGVFEGRRLLRSESLALMHTRQYPTLTGSLVDLWGSESAGYGLAWWVDDVDGDRHIAHSGSAPGYTAFLMGNLDRRLGVALLSNGNRAHTTLINLARRAVDLLEDHTLVPADPVGQ